jgi:hypothetical protein
MQSLILLLVIFAVFFVLKVLNPEKFSKYPHFTTRIGATSINSLHEWHSSFTYLDGSVQGWITARSGQTKLILSSYMEEGKIVYKLYDHTGTLQYSFPVGQPTDTLTGAFESGERYEIRATATQAKGSFDFRME